VHEGEHPAKVECTVRAAPDETFIRWRIRVRHRARPPVFAVYYPQAACFARLGDYAEDDAVLCPRHEGQVYTAPALRMPDGRREWTTYPGSASAQFLYLFDPGGGLYTAAEDAGGRRKILMLERHGDSLLLGFSHRFSSEAREVTTPEYEVVWTAAGGRWEDGADIYRAWAEQQPWCARTLVERGVPDWLRGSNVFLNYSVDGPEGAAPTAMIRGYRQLLGLPVVAVPFGWEKHGAWIGPDYFPPRGGEAAYRRLAEDLAGMDSHLQVYLSGFRWGVRKPKASRGGRPREYTDYDGRSAFEERGRAAAVVEPDGGLLLQQRPWADNYALCVGSSEARELIAECFREPLSWGVAGVDLDQNVGAAVSPCWSTEHSHQPGEGMWLHESMSSFLDGVRGDVKAAGSDRFVGVEEPCEAYNQQFDVYHGRAFTDVRWPVSGPGAVSVPLFSYLYHDYIVGYAGWCDQGFSPIGDVRIGLARAFLFGMQPGVRIGRAPFPAEPDPDSTAIALLRDVAHLMDRTAEYLLLGRMLPAPRLEGSPPLDIPEWVRERHPIPVEWPAVQATAWRSASGNVCYAVANLTGQIQAVELTAEANGMPAPRVRLERINPDGRAALRESASLPSAVPVRLAPWGICCIEQTAAR
jgi:hypothetical protein